MTNSRPYVRRQIAPGDNIEFPLASHQPQFFQSFGAAAVHVLSSSEGAFDATRPASCILSRHYGRTQAQGLPSPKGVSVSMQAGVRWSHAGVSRRALLAAPKGKWPSPIQRPVELPRLARPKGCFAAHGGGSIDELSGRTTGRLGYIRPTTAHAIGGTAELALRYSYHLRIFRRAEPLQGATMGRTVL